MLLSRVSIDIRSLPSLVPPSQLNITARALVPVIEDDIAKLKTLLASNDLSLELNPTPPDPTCQFAVYAQVHPSNVSAAAMRELEDELMNPTGITTVDRPPFRLDVAVISPECGILIVGKDADGMRSRIFFRKVTSCTSTPWFCSIVCLSFTDAGFAGLVYLVMLLLLSHQMSESRTPATLSRISRWSFIAQALADAIAFAGVGLHNR
jgi:transmembrane E3 ubiquitin-protein ligase